MNATSTQKLNDKFNEALDNFREQSEFLVASHDERYLTTEHIEEINRNVYYLLTDVQKIFMEYIKGV